MWQVSQMGGLLANLRHAQHQASRPPITRRASLHSPSRQASTHQAGDGVGVHAGRQLHDFACLGLDRLDAPVLWEGAAKFRTHGQTTAKLVLSTAHMLSQAWRSLAHSIPVCNRSNSSCNRAPCCRCSLLAGTRPRPAASRPGEPPPQPPRAPGQRRRRWCWPAGVRAGRQFKGLMVSNSASTSMAEGRQDCDG